MAQTLDYPIVYADTSSSVGEISTVNCVSIETYASATKVLKHLVEKGHERIGCICGGKDNRFYTNRLKAYKDVLSKADLPILEDSLHFCDDNRIDIGKACCKLLDNLHKTRLSAVFCFNDYRAMVLLEEAKKRNIKVPEELAIAGFDGHEKAIKQGITTVELSPAHIATESLLVLQSLLEGTIHPPVQKTISGGLIVGKTT